MRNAIIGRPSAAYTKAHDIFNLLSYVYSSNALCVNFFCCTHIVFLEIGDGVIIRSLLHVCIRE